MNDLTKEQKSAPEDPKPYCERIVDDLLYGIEDIRADLIELEALAHAAAHALEHVPYYARIDSTGTAAGRRSSTDGPARPSSSIEEPARTASSIEEPARPASSIEEPARPASSIEEPAPTAGLQPDVAPAGAQPDAATADAGPADSTRPRLRVRTEAEVRLHMDRLQTLVRKTADAALSALTATNKLLDDREHAPERRAPDKSSPAGDKIWVVNNWQRHMATWKDLLDSFERN